MTQALLSRMREPTGSAGPPMRAKPCMSRVGVVP